MAFDELLDPYSLPRFDEITPERIFPALDAAISAHQNVVAELVAERPTDFDQVWLPLERADAALTAFWSAVSHKQAVADSPELRAAYSAGQKRIVENASATSQNRELFDVLQALSITPEFATLPDADRAAVEKSLRDFALSGVALEAAARDRFRAISIELSSLGTDFSSAVLDATDAWTEVVTDEKRLSGLSDADKAMFAALAKARGLDGWLITLQQPSVAAVLTFAEDRDLRERVYGALGTRASDQGPHAGQFDNSNRIARILELRREAAALLGFPDPVTWSLATKMASNSAEVLAFLRDLAARAKPAAEAELEDLRAFSAQRLGISELQPWDVSFVSNRLRAERHAFDEQRARDYFPVDAVLKGWKTLLSRLFGVRLVERSDKVLWHPDASYFDVVDEQDGSLLAGVFVDLHARPGKRGGAWMSAARSRLRDGAEAQVPVAYMVCNFAPIGGGTPPLLSHGDIRTLLHETGHCLHHIFTRVDRPSVAGVSGFEWDAIELPSQLMEDFVWDRDVLTMMSSHYETGEELPQDMYDAILRTRNFQSGLVIVRQLEFALFDILLHQGTLGSDPMEVLEAVRDEVAVLRPPEWHRFPHSFSHIFAGPYASGYYSYLWAEVLAADGFQRFAEAGLIDRPTGNLFREEVLSRGSVRPAAESFRAFRGRDPDPKALLVRHGLA